MNAAPGETAPWQDAVLAAAILAVDAYSVGGVALRAAPRPWRDRWLALLRCLVPETEPIRRLPLHVSEDRLLGGIDLAASLNAGRPIVCQGILAETHSGILLAAMAERLEPVTVAHLAAVLDRGQLTIERDGISTLQETCIGIVALDEGIEDDERPPAGLLDRLAIHLDLNRIERADDTSAYGADDIMAARRLLCTAQYDSDAIAALCHAAIVFGVAGARAPLVALRVARIHAALDGRRVIEASDLAVAGRLVLAPRATTIPATPKEPPADDDRPDDQDNDVHQTEGDDVTGTTLDSSRDVVVDAIKAAVPPNILDAIRLTETRGRAASSGRAGQRQKSLRRGRPAGTRAGDPRRGARLDLVETLRAAVPWQALRRRDRKAGTAARIEVRQSDFRVTRFKHRTETMTIFVVDASGSSALHRLGEAKGAVEHLLADCYARRDHVALIAFRGRDAEVVLPPTRSLARAKRCLAALPGGGGTPLATAIDAAASLADAAERKGQTPIIVVMTDGRANIARDGEPDRTRAEEDALAAARQSRGRGFASLLIDTAPRPRPFSGRLAETLGSTYLPLPNTDAGALSKTIRTATENARQQFLA